MGFSRQEYCSGLPFPSPGDLPDPGIEPRSPALQADALTSEPAGKPIKKKKKSIFSSVFQCFLNSKVGSSYRKVDSSHTEKAMAPHSSTLVWKIPWMEEPDGLQSMGSLRVRHDWVTSLSLSCIGEGNGNPLQCSCLENPRDGGAWWAAVCRVTQSWTRLKWLSSSSSSSSYKIAYHYR